AGIVPSVADHPLARLHRMNVPVTLATDDTTVSDITLSEEYLNAVEEIGLTLPEVWAIDRHALDVAFADEADIAPLREEFKAWGAAIPELHDGDAGIATMTTRAGRLRGSWPTGSSCAWPTKRMSHGSWPTAARTRTSSRRSNPNVRRSISPRPTGSGRWRNIGRSSMTARPCGW